MGYDLHITRRKDWSEKGDDITAEEWLAYVEHDAELRLRPENGAYFAEWSGSVDSWLDWSDGQIHTKNPGNALIDKMVAVARELEAAVQGDDGETYDGSTEQPVQPRRSVGQRVADWFSRLRSRQAAEIGHPVLPFGVNDRVRDSWGNEHTVISIDPKAEQGMGVIRTRRSDGTEHAHSLIAHGLERITK